MNSCRDAVSSEPGRRLCIAVVDDEPTIRVALGRLLRAAGHSVVLFASGSDFLASLSGRRPDCVILDFAMPGLTGLDVVSRLKASGAEIPAIVITARDDLQLESRSIDAGARALLRKPFLGDQLFAAVEAAARC